MNINVLARLLNSTVVYPNSRQKEVISGTDHLSFMADKCNSDYMQGG